MNQKTILAGIQLEFSNSPDKNLTKTLTWVAKAARKGAKIICLPELYRTQYLCQREDSRLFDLAETIPGPSTKAFMKIAKEYKVVIILPLFEKRAPGIYHNSAAIIDSDGKMLGIYRKMHIPDDPSYYEKYYFTPGDLGFKTFNTKEGRIGTLICWDQWYPEGARITSLKGASALFYPTAIGWHPKEIKRYGEAQRDSWKTIQRAHAIANGVYLVSVNRIGLEKPDSSSDGILFWGSSFICDPQGVVLAEASQDTEEIIYAEMDLTHLETIRRNWPFLRDRRVDSYSEISNRYLD